MARGTAARGGLALTVQTDLQALVRALRNLDGNRGLGAHHAATLTLMTWVGHNLALATTAVAQRHVHELAKDRLLHAPDFAAAFALRALDRLGAGLHAIARA